jgi:hypothetical protein
MSGRGPRRLPRIDRLLLRATIHPLVRIAVPPTIRRAGRSPARAITHPPGRIEILRLIRRAGRSPARVTTRLPGRTGTRRPIRRAGRSPARATIHQLTALRRPTARMAPGRRPRNQAPTLPQAQAAGARWIGMGKPAHLLAATPGTSPVQVLTILRVKVEISGRWDRPELAISKTEAAGTSGCLRAKRIGIPTGRRSMWPLTEE